MVLLIQTVFGGANVVGGGINTLCFNDPSSGAQADDFATAVGEFWGDVMTVMDEDVSFEVQPGARELVSSTGALQNVYPTVTTNADIGQVSGNAVPRASQALIRLQTEDIVNGRQIKGRVFIPGIAGIHLTDAGGLSSSVVTILNAAVAQLMTATNSSLVVWHRPVNGSGGSTHLVTGASTWDQFAVLRSRRD